MVFVWATLKLAINLNLVSVIAYNYKEGDFKQLIYVTPCKNSKYIKNPEISKNSDYSRLNSLDLILIIFFDSITGNALLYF